MDRITYTAAVKAQYPVRISQAGRFATVLDARSIPAPAQTPEHGPHYGPECRGAFYRVELARISGRLYWQIPGGPGTGDGVYPLTDEERAAIA